MITKEQVEKALDELEKTEISKASEQDLDQPEGADLGNPAKEKMSDKAKGDAKLKKEAKKSMDSDEEEDEDGDEEMEEKGMKAKKSFHDLPEEVETKIDVSDFLKSLVEHTAESIDSITDAISKSQAETVENYNTLAETVEDIQKSQAKIGIVLKALCEKVGIIENAPAKAPKAETVAKSDEANEPAERVFKSGLEGENGDNGEEPMFKSLSKNPHVAKSQISNALCDLVKSGKATDMDVIGFESNNFIRPEIVTELKTILN